jgi:hypothetical protein
MDNFSLFHEFTLEVNQITKDILSECNVVIITLNKFLIEGLISPDAIQKIFQTAEELSNQPETSMSDNLAQYKNKIVQGLKTIKDQVQNSPLAQKISSDNRFRQLATSQLNKKANKLKKSAAIYNSIVDEYLKAAEKNANSIPMITGIFNSALSMKQNPTVIHAFLQQGLAVVRNVKESLTEAPFSWATRAGQWLKNNAEISKTINSNTRASFGSKKPTVTKDQLEQLWQQAGAPRDLDDVVRILSRAGFNNTHIKEILKQSGLKFGAARDSKIVALAKIIKSTGLKDRVLKYLEAQMGITEAIDPTVNLQAITLTDEQIKGIFAAVVGNQVRAKQQAQNEPENRAQYYLKQWMRSFQSADQKQKENLVREMVNYWADRKNQPDWQTYVPKLTAIFQHSGLDKPFVDRAIMSLQKGKSLIQLRTLEGIQVTEDLIRQIFDSL